MCADDQAMISALRQRALALSLRYNFVTELTSLIVVQENPLPNENGNFTLGQNLDSSFPEQDGGINVLNSGALDSGYNSANLSFKLLSAMMLPLSVILWY